MTSYDLQLKNIHAYPNTSCPDCGLVRNILENNDCTECDHSFIIVRELAEHNLKVVK